LTTIPVLDKISLKFTKDPAAGCFLMKEGSVVGRCYNYRRLLNDRRSSFRMLQVGGYSMVLI